MSESDLLPSELAATCGVSTGTIRHYEKKGVIQKAHRGSNGYRRYPPESITRLQLVRRALSIGFSLDEIAQIFRRRENGQPPCREVRSLAEERLGEMNERIHQMIQMREDLASVVKAWDVKLAATADGEPALLLESLEKGKEDALDRSSRRHTARPTSRRR